MTQVALATESFAGGAVDPLPNPPWKPGGDAGGMERDGTGHAQPNNTANDATSYYDDGAISWPDDQYAKGDIATTEAAGSGAGPGLCVRHILSATATYYRAVADHGGSNNVRLSRVNAGSFTALQSFTKTWTDGDTWELWAQGGTGNVLLTIYCEGVLVGTFTDTSGSSLASGAPGIAYSSSAATPTIDNWEGGELIADAVAVAWLRA